MKNYIKGIKGIIYQFVSLKFYLRITLPFQLLPIFKLLESRNLFLLT